MGRSRKRPAEGAALTPGGDNYGPGDPPRAVLAASCCGRWLAVALGERVLVLDVK